MPCEVEVGRGSRQQTGLSVEMRRGVRDQEEDLGDRRITERTFQGQLKKRVSKKVRWPLSAETNPGIK